VGLYLGVHVDPVTMFYAYLVTYSQNVYTSKNNIITTVDIFPNNFTVQRDIKIVLRARPGEGEELNRETIAAILLRAKREKDKYAETVNKQKKMLVFLEKSTVKNYKAIEG